MRHAQPGGAAPSARPFVRNPFPTLVMAGIVNSIASELDVVGARLVRARSVECGSRHVPVVKGRELRSVGASVK